MQDPDVYVHIGLSKCASTYLQKIIFPGIGNYSNVAFAPDEDKYHLLRPDMTPDEYRRIVAKHMVNPLPECKWLLISCEDYTELLFKGFTEVFFKWTSIKRESYRFSNEVIAENIARTYPKARIIVVIREQLDWAVSRYKMNYRGGKTSLSIDDLMDEPLEGYDIMVERYQNRFGKENVLVLPLEMMRRDCANFVKSITGFIGTNFTKFAPDIKVNAAPELNRTVEYERLKNRWRLNIRHALWLTPPIQFILKIMARLLVALLKPFFFLRYGASKFSASPSAETIQQLKPGLVSSNRRLEKLTGLDLAQYGYLVSHDR